MDGRKIFTQYSGISSCSQESTYKAIRRNGNDEEEMRESGDEVHGRSFLLLRNRLDKGQQNMGSPAKGTRSTTRGDVGPQREGRGRKN